MIDDLEALLKRNFTKEEIERFSEGAFKELEHQLGLRTKKVGRGRLGRMDRAKALKMHYEGDSSLVVNNLMRKRVGPNKGKGKEAEKRQGEGEERGEGGEGGEGGEKGEGGEGGEGREEGEGKKKRIMNCSVCGNPGGKGNPHKCLEIIRHVLQNPTQRELYFNFKVPAMGPW